MSSSDETEMKIQNNSVNQSKVPITEQNEKNILEESKISLQMADQDNSDINTLQLLNELKSENQNTDLTTETTENIEIAEVFEMKEEVGDKVDGSTTDLCKKKRLAEPVSEIETSSPPQKKQKTSTWGLRDPRSGSQMNPLNWELQEQTTQDINLDDEVAIVIEDNYPESTETLDLYIANVPPQWTKNQVWEFIIEHCPDVTKSPVLIFQKNNLENVGAVLVQFKKCEDLKKACCKLDGIEVDGKTLCAFPDVGGCLLELHKMNTSLLRYQAKFGSLDSDGSIGRQSPQIIVDLTTEQTNTTDSCKLHQPFGSFWEPPSVNTWLNDPNGLYGFNEGFLKKLGITGKLCEQVVVTNTTNTDMDKLFLKDVFQWAGNISYIHMSKQNKSTCVIVYNHPVEAVQAISMLNGRKFNKWKLVVKMNAHKPYKPTWIDKLGPGLGENGKPLKNILYYCERFVFNQNLQNSDKINEFAGYDLAEERDKFVAAIKNFKEQGIDFANLMSVLNMVYQKDHPHGNTTSNNMTGPSAQNNPGCNSNGGSMLMNNNHGLMNYAMRNFAPGPNNPNFGPPYTQMNFPNPTNNFNPVVSGPFRNSIPSDASMGFNFGNNILSNPAGMGSNFRNAGPSNPMGPGFGPRGPCNRPMIRPPNSGGTFFNPNDNPAPSNYAPVPPPMLTDSTNASPTGVPAASENTFKNSTLAKKPSNMVIFDGLPPSVTQQVLYNKMCECGESEVKFVELTSPGHAFVRFRTVEMAERCLLMFNKSRVDGQIIQVRYF